MRFAATSHDFPSATVGDRLSRSQHAAVICALLLFAGIVWWQFGEGFIGGGFDDTQYSEAALKWLEAAPYFGETHWALRLPVVLPLALVFKLFGVSQVTTLILPVAVSAVLIVLTYIQVNKYFGALAAAICCLILITLPQFIENATTVNPDVLELTFIAGSLWALLAVRDSRRPVLLVVVSGVLLSLAWLTRQTTAGYIVFLALTFVFHPLVPRRYYFIMAAASLPLVLAEFAFYAWHTGDVLYRMHVDMRHINIPSAQMMGQVSTESSPILNMKVAAQWVQPGVLHVHWLVDPYLHFFADRHYGLLFLLSVPFSYLAIRTRSAQRDSRILAVFMAAGAVWFLVSVYVLVIRPQPRYFGPIIYGAALVTAVGLSQLALGGRRLLAGGILAATALVALALADMAENRDEVAFSVVESLRAAPEPVFVPQDLLNRTQLHIRAPELLGRLRPVAAPGGLALRLGIAPAPCVTGVVHEEWPRAKRTFNLLQPLGLTARLPHRLKGIEDPTRPVLVMERLCG